MLVTVLASRKNRGRESPRRRAEHGDLVDWLNYSQDGGGNRSNHFLLFSVFREQDIYLATCDTKLI